MANIGTGELSNSIATVVAAEALGYLKKNTVLARLVSRDWDNEVQTHGQVVTIPYSGALSVNDKAADTAVTLQTPSDSAYTVTLNKHKEVSFLIEDIGRALARPDWLSIYMEDGLAMLSEQVDTDIAALYSGLSQSIDASAGLGEDDFRLARRYLNTAKAPMSQRYAVIHEDAEYELLGIEKFVNQDYKAQLGADSLGLINAFSGRYVGFDVFTSQNIPTATTHKNLFFHKNAMVLATRPLPPAPGGAGVIQRVMHEDGMGLRVTVSYNPNHLGVQVTIDVLYGVAELRDAFGVVVLTQDL